MVQHMFNQLFHKVRIVLFDGYQYFLWSSSFHSPCTSAEGGGGQMLPALYGDKVVQGIRLIS